MLIIFGYLKHHTKRRIICETSLLEYQLDVDIELNWLEIYPDSVEELQTDIPYPKSKPIRNNTFVDSYHSHYPKTWRSVIGSMMLQKTSSGISTSIILQILQTMSQN